MQPYFFPYIGYFQLIHAVDVFVFLDDVPFIKKGWINRNRLAFNETATWFTVPLRGQSQHTLINDVRIAPEEFRRWRRKFMLSLQHFYGKAPHYQTGMALVDEVLAPDSDRMANLAVTAITACCRLLGITTRFFSSSAFSGSDLRGEERLIDLCNQASATEYINAPGGIGLYTKERFARNGLGLQFLLPGDIAYQADTVTHRLEFSILDAVMWCGPERISDNFLQQYSLSDG